jgi:formiminotetrahydrofolate cyclodeaminase
MNADDAEVSLGSLTLGAYLDALACKAPVPGGGAAAALTGATAAALAAMVVRYSQGKKALAAHEPMLADALARLERARGLLLGLADADAAAYGVLNAAMRRDKADAGREAAVRAAAGDAILPPRAVMAAGIDLLRLCGELAATTTKMLASDLAIAAMLSRAAVHAGAANVRVNLPLIGGDEADALAAECARSEAEADERERSVRAETGRGSST